MNRTGPYQVDGVYVYIFLAFLVFAIIYLGSGLDVETLVKSATESTNMAS